MNYRDLIQKQFEQVISYSQSYLYKEEVTINATNLFNDWWWNKKHLRSNLPFFSDDRWIYEYPEIVSFGLDENTKRERLDRFVRELWDFPLLQDFLRKNKANFFENRIVEDYKAPNGTCRRGMKIIKAFKYFFSNDMETLKRLQDEASAILNEDKIEGKFCVSIHPLDYISISDNDHNWHSCHAMNSDYRAGNLCYMADHHTVVCYVKTGEDRKISNFPDEVPWNSKKWRMLLFFDTSGDFVMAGKQYPLQSGEALNHFQEAYSKAWEAAREANEGVTNCFKFSPWHKEQINSISLDGLEYKFSVSMIPYGDYMLGLDEVYSKSEGSLQYDDIIKNSTYRESVPYAYAITDLRWGFFTEAGITYPNGDQTSRYLFANRRNGPVITAGHEVKCLHCGESTIQTGDAVLCDRCALEYIKPEMLDEDYYPTCDICGERFIYYDGFWRDDMHVCASCGQKYDEDLNLIDNKEEDYNGPWC